MSGSSNRARLGVARVYEMQGKLDEGPRRIRRSEGRLSRSTPSGRPSDLRSRKQRTRTPGWRRRVPQAAAGADGSRHAGRAARVFGRRSGVARRLRPRPAQPTVRPAEQQSIDDLLKGWNSISARRRARTDTHRAEQRRHDRHAKRSSRTSPPATGRARQPPAADGAATAARRCRNERRACCNRQAAASDRPVSHSPWSSCD